MSRRINTGGAAGLVAAPGATIDDFLGRLVKYIPAEIVGLYVAALGLAKDYQQITFFGCLILTPVFLWFATRDPAKGPLWLQVLLGTVAFPVWAIAIPSGPYSSLFPSQITSLLLLFVTVIFGLIKPPAGS
jgi:hypothetical protein